MLNENQTRAVIFFFITIFLAFLSIKTKSQEKQDYFNYKQNLSFDSLKTWQWLDDEALSITLHEPVIELEFNFPVNTQSPNFTEAKEFATFSE